MAILDIILLICFIPAIVHGISKGFVSQALEILALLIGAWAAFHFSSMLGKWAAQHLTMDPTLMNILCFVIIMTLAVVLLTMVGNLLTRFLKIIALGWLNAILGLAFGVLKTILVLGLLVMIFESLNGVLNLVKPDATDNAVVYNCLREFAEKIFPYLKGLVTSGNE